MRFFGVVNRIAKNNRANSLFAVRPIVFSVFMEAVKMVIREISSL